MTDKIRIVYFITSLESGGTERQLILLLASLPGAQYEKHIVCLSGLGPLHEQFQKYSTSITDLRYPRLRRNGRLIWKNLPTTATSVLRLVKILRRLRPDILHTLIPVCNVMGAIAGKLVRVPVIVSSRLSLGNYRDSNKLFARMEDTTDPCFTLIHCKSKGIKEDVIRREPVDPDRLKVIYNGLKVDSYGRPFDKSPLRDSLGIDISSPVIGMVANLKTYKGYHDMVRAAPSILKNFPTARFLFVGRDDGIKSELIALAKALQVEETIIFTGERHDVPRLLQLMTLLVSASHEEGFSNTILEAMASGLPVVATSVGGNPEQVVDGVTGFLVTPGDSDELAAAICRLLADPAEAQKMGRHGNLRIARKFSHTAVTEKMIDFYKDAIALESV